MNGEDDSPRARRSSVEDQPASEHEIPARRPSGNSPPPKKDSSRDGEKPPKEPWYRRPLLVGFLILIVIGGTVGGVLFWEHSRTYEETDDAFVDVVSQQVSSQVPGRVVRVHVNDNQDVKAGDLLVELDPADFQSRVDQALASVAQAQAQEAQAQAQRTVYEAQLAQSKANLGAAEASATNATNDLRRYQELREANVAAVSSQQLDSAISAAANATAQVEVARKAVVASEAQIGYAGSLIEAAASTVKNANTQVDQAKLSLSYTQIKAAVDGRVVRKTVSDGNYIQPGTPLMGVVPPAVYITANFKETQLAHMRRNQPVEVTVDAYPELKLRGHVDSTQTGTGQVFSILPAENATGNWVKVVQRVPVKIVLDHLPDDPDRRLSPGMSADVTVTVR